MENDMETGEQLWQAAPDSSNHLHGCIIILTFQKGIVCRKLDARLVFHDTTWRLVQACCVRRAGRDSDAW